MKNINSQPILDYMKNHNLSIKQLQEKSGVSIYILNKLIYGYNDKISTSIVVKLCDFLQIPCDSLLIRKKYDINKSLFRLKIIKIKNYNNLPTKKFCELLNLSMRDYMDIIELKIDQKQMKELNNKIKNSNLKI